MENQEMDRTGVLYDSLMAIDKSEAAREASERVSAALDEVHRQIALVFGHIAGLSDAELAVVTKRLGGIRARLEALWCSAVAEGDQRQLGKQHGMRDTSSWLAATCGERLGDMRRDVELSERLAALDVIAEQFESGELSKAKVVELARIADATLYEQAELLAVAKRASVTQLGHHVSRLLTERGEIGTRRSELSISDVPGGGIRLSGSLTCEDAEYVSVSTHVAADALSLGGYTASERRAAGLVAVCRYFLEHHDRPTRDRRGRPAVNVTIDLPMLMRNGGGTGTFESGRVVTGEVARRMACDSGVNRIITDGASQVLDAGRTNRTVNPGQARAIIHRDRHCRYLGCSSPPWSCEVHHVAHWIHGGQSDLKNLALLCWHHHDLIHELDLDAAATQARMRDP
jgi:hypothetical protein